MTWPFKKKGTPEEPSFIGQALDHFNAGSVDVAEEIADRHVRAASQDLARSDEMAITTLSFSVMAHPDRAEFFPYLRRRLNIRPESFAVDHDRKGAWETCKAAWRLSDPMADWHCVVQDDAIVCDDFRARAIAAIVDARAVLGGRDDYALSFYYGDRRYERIEAGEALKRGFRISPSLSWGLAVCLRTKDVEEMIAYGDTRTKIGTKDDARISAFLQHKGVPVYLPMPSLVEHREGKSLVGDPGEHRRAFAYIDRDKNDSRT